MSRVALVCDWYHPRRGGIEAHLAGLAIRLRARGDEVHVITSTPGPAMIDGVAVHRLDVARMPWFGVAVQPIARRIGEILEREQIDVVHNHVSIIAPVALSGGFEANRRGLPNVLTFHSFVPLTPVWAGLAGRLMGASHWPAIMTAVSARVVREVSAFAPHTTFSILPNAIDTAFWTPSEAAPPPDEVTLVYAGRLQVKKRPLLLLDVLEGLRRSAPSIRFRLRVIGTGDLEKTLRARAIEQGLAGHVDFIGWVKPVELRELLRSSSMFLSTATRESFGLAALEARGVGVPVVAMRDSAVADFITHEQSGLLADDDAAFVRAVTRLATDASLRNRIAAHNRTTPVPFSWDNALALHDAAYDRATANVASRHRG